MNNLLITGAGSKFTKLIIKRIYKNYDKIFLLTNKSVPKYNNKKIRHIKVDLSSSANIPVKVNEIIHMAALVPYNNKFANKVDVLNVNLKITYNLLRYAIKNKIKKIIFTSSTDVYPLYNNKKINLKTSLNCHNDYGLSKIASERLLKTCSDIFNISLIILRIGPVYSEENPNCNKISKIIFDIKKNHNIQIYNPENVVSFLNINCASKAICKSLKMNSGTFIVAGASLNIKKFLLKARKTYKSISKIQFKKKKLSKIKMIFDLKNQRKKFKWMYNKSKMFNA